MHNSKNITLSALALMACALAAPMRANPAIQATLTDWVNATAAGYGVVDFENFSGTPFVGSPYSSGGVTFTAPNNYLFIGNSSTGWDIGSNEYLYSAYPITISVPGGISSFAANLSDYAYGDFLNVVVNTSSGSFTYVVDSPGNNASAFFGFTLGAGETLGFVSVGSPHDAAVIDNVRFGTTGAAVPDSGSTALLLGMAGLGMWFSRRRLRA